MRNIGTAADRVAEIFGIVVDHHDRGRNIGSGLLDYLCEALRDDVDVILCEARTGDVRGWKVVRHAGFHPIGFEPFAHKTPVGSESMLLTARFRKAANPHPAAVFATDRARDLARAVAQCSLDSQPFYQEPEPRCPLPPCPPHPDGAPFSLIRDDVKGAEILSKWRDRFRHRSGVVDLRRIEGINLPGRPRYDARHYLLCQPDQVLSCGASCGITPTAARGSSACNPNARTPATRSLKASSARSRSRPGTVRLSSPSTSGPTHPNCSTGSSL